jgi:excisionase family DNA binding protein
MEKETTFWTIDEAAEYLHESKYTIYQWTATKKIPFYKRGKNLRFKVEEILTWDEQFHQVARCG